MLNGLMMNTPLTVTAIMQFAEQVHADSEIVSLQGNGQPHRYTYAEAFRRVRQLANALQGLGIQQGDRVATLAWNDHRHLELYYAISCSGAVCHTINPRLFPEQIEYIINHADDKLLFVDLDFLPLLEGMKEKLDCVEQIIVLTEEAQLPTSTLSNIQSYETLIASQLNQYDWPALDEQTASALCYTSGTTGNPKGVLYSHRSTVLHAYALALPDTFNLSARDAVMPVVPMFHVNAWGLPYSAVMVGAKLVLPGSHMGDGAALTTLINKEGVTLSAGVPTVWLALLQTLRETQQAVPTLERVIVGGAACPQVIMDEFLAQHGVKVLHVWGMTETSPIGTINTPKRGMDALPQAQRDALRLKQGRPVFGVDMKIDDPDGKVQPWDGKAVGEVKLRGPWICSNYYRVDAKSEAHDEDGWFATGDIASIDPQGYMQITDRSKDVIKSGGEWISSIALENAVMGHPGVKEAAVIGLPHPKWTERPLMLVVKEAGTDITTDSLLIWLQEKVAKWWLPDDILFVDSLPHTATGKLSKKTLREHYKDHSFM